MKLNMAKFSFRGLYLMLGALLLNVMAFAQDSTTTATTTTTAATTTEKTWYMEPWAWVVGAIILILIIVAVSRGSNSSTDKVTVTKTVTRDTDV